MQKFIVAFFLIFCAIAAKSQNWGTYNTGTLYDAFENPSQKTFTPDSSRRFAFNCFIMNGGFSYAGRGPAAETIRKLFYLDSLDVTNLDGNEVKYNRLFTDGNYYVAMFRFFKTMDFNREMGFSWQIKSSGDIFITNQTFITVSNPVLGDKIEFNDNLNNKGGGQAYHQFSLTYRENYDRRLAFGAKLSYLSGIAYDRIQIDHSKVLVDIPNKSFEINAKGYMLTNIKQEQASSIKEGLKVLTPGFNNPGFAITASMNYLTPRGLKIIGNIKDLGKIYWRKNTVKYIIDADASINTKIQNKLIKFVQSDLISDSVEQKFNSNTNAKAELILSKSYGSYQPNLIFSKSLLNDNGNIVLVNNYNYKNLKGSLIAGYDLRKILEIGAQVLYKKPNFECFLGSDRLLKTIMIAKGVSRTQENLKEKSNNKIPGSGYTGASFYMGLSFKFGEIMHRWQDSSYIPGLKYPKLNNDKSKKENQKEEEKNKKAEKKQKEMSKKKN